eukprot:5643815-Pyramimonas_sp.AAC.1
MSETFVAGAMAEIETFPMRQSRRFMKFSPSTSTYKRGLPLKALAPGWAAFSMSKLLPTSKKLPWECERHSAVISADALCANTYASQADVTELEGGLFKGT